MKVSLKEKIVGMVSPFSAAKFLLRKPVTIRYPSEKTVPSERYRGMHSNDTEICIGCGNCSRICPTNAIKMVPIPSIERKPGKRNVRPKIDYGRCCFCALCVDICPTGSLQMTRHYEYIDPDPSTFNFIPTKHMAEAEGWKIDIERAVFSPKEYAEKVLSFKIEKDSGDNSQKEGKE